MPGALEAGKEWQGRQDGDAGNSLAENGMRSEGRAAALAALGLIQIAALTEQVVSAQWHVVLAPTGALACVSVTGLPAAAQSSRAALPLLLLEMAILLSHYSLAARGLVTPLALLLPAGRRMVCRTDGLRTDVRPVRLRHDAGRAYGRGRRAWNR